MKTIKFPIREEIPDIKESDFDKYLFIVVMIASGYYVINYCIKTQTGYKLYGIFNNDCYSKSTLWTYTFQHRYNDFNLLQFLLRFSNEMKRRDWNEEIILVENVSELLSVLNKYNIYNNNFITAGKDLLENIGPYNYNIY